MKQIDQKIREMLDAVYGPDDMAIRYAAERFNILISRFRERFGGAETSLFSAPGRAEIGGNHTDHNHGRVLAAAIDLDSVALAAKNTKNVIMFQSEGYDDVFHVDLADLTPNEQENQTTTALIRGIAAQFKQLGYRIGGFNACVSSQVLPGSGLSSSASIEVLIGTIMNTLYNDGAVAPETIAKFGQFAENKYFSKPCGLMDQIACAVGGMVAIDFADPQNPVIQQIDYKFNRSDHTLLVVYTGGNHADLTPSYAAIPEEMKAVASTFGKDVLREIRPDLLKDNISSLRESVGDRAILRAFHFAEENKRVVAQVEALQQDDFDRFLQLVGDSGRSSCRWLQNCFAPNDTRHQGLMLGLAMTEMTLGDRGACRVHGGGFAGTILVFMPDDQVSDYIQLVESVFEAGCVSKLSIRSTGAVCLGELTI